MQPVRLREDLHAASTLRVKGALTVGLTHVTRPLLGKPNALETCSCRASFIAMDPPFRLNEGSRPQ